MGGRKEEIERRWEERREKRNGEWGGGIRDGEKSSRKEGVIGIGRVKRE